MDMLRIRYSKTGKAKYISHLDLMSTMQRAFIRAGASLKYSEGFNPHPRISVALPAPVGTESLCELMDVSLAGSSISDKINRYLPEGLHVSRAYRAFRGFKDIKWVEVECRFLYDGICPQGLADTLEERFLKKSLVISKKTKRGTAEIDVAPHICDVKTSLSGNSCVVLEAKISAQNPTISGKDISAIAMADGFGGDISAPESIEIKRIDIYDANMLLFK